MEKYKRWHVFLILAVVVLTLYNIFPTLFYYSNSLKKNVDAKDAQKVATAIVKRINNLEPFTLSWLKAQAKNIGVKPIRIALNKENSRIAEVEFKKAEDARFFQETLLRAGALIPFAPAQLTADKNIAKGEKTTTVYVQRKIGTHITDEEKNTLFHYIPKEESKGVPSNEYRALINDRVSSLALSLGGIAPTAKLIYESPAEIKDAQERESFIRLARKISEYERTFGDQNPLTQRFFATFSQIEKEKSNGLISKFEGQLRSIENTLSSEIDTLKQERTLEQNKGGFLNTDAQQRLEALENQQTVIKSATAIVARNRSLFEKGIAPLTKEELFTSLTKEPHGFNKKEVIEIGDRNPFIARITLDWNKDIAELTLHKDIEAIRNQTVTNEIQGIEVEKINQLLYNDIARASQETDETITPLLTGFSVEFNNLTNSTALLALNLDKLANLEIQNLHYLLTHNWQPTLKDFTQDNYPVESSAELSKNKLGIILYNPLTEKEASNEGFRKGSLYVVLRGLKSISNKYEEVADSAEKRAFQKDFDSLKQLMRKSGFIGYYGTGTLHQNDYIFEWDNFYSYILAASREDFSVKGSKHFALLEFTDIEQRILTQNKIEDQMHEDLVKWRDNYNEVRVNMNPQAKYDVPKPTKNVLWDNILLSAKKYFRGDQRKILKWGLDLSGGKSVRIGLKDQDNQPITDPDDLKSAVNELYQRVNKLGLSEVALRIEGNNIAVDFPGSQGISASELIQASAMYFHVVNEKFSPHNPTLREAVTTFLEEVWNEAVITNRTQSDELNMIAWQHLGGNPENPHEFNPLTSHAQLLYSHGLRLANPKDRSRSSNFNDEFSMITRFRGSDFTEWMGQTNPLLIVFNNYALEGAQLTDVAAGYDPQEGNVLHFNVGGSYVNRLGQKINPRDTFYMWTSQFSEEKIGGTEKEKYSGGRGWRMAVILNGSVISAPSLNAALRDSARITGHFTQTEVNKLASDLKAGSLSFTPEILSEENVSPDLGKEQRTQGIVAGAIGVLLVIIIMCGYYRFAGFVAICAVLFNLLIIWAVLQNLGAALTLPGIAGIILVVGMSVDANVLVFERVREEFALTQRIGPSLRAGYRKAFTAIVDSNLTTIIAALILLNFDSGPIKGFALTLIIGILSSMFTSLFMTRTFFAKWVQNPNHKTLSMMHLFKETKFNFLNKAKVAFFSMIVIMIIGAFFFMKERSSILGMDFTGGYALTLDLQEKPGANYRTEAFDALVAAGANPSDVQIRELNKPHLLRIQLAKAFEQPSKPFYEIEQKIHVDHPLFSYEANPRIVWIVQSLEKAGLSLDPTSLPDLNLHWTQVSGQLSDVMRNQALIGLMLSLVAILIYVTFRFEFTYAISATLALAHDLLITISLIAIFHPLWSGLQIDLQVIAALMTIVGYSLNDTIIIFDRIREDLKLSRKRSFTEVVNHALNATLSRTVMTSMTTLVVLLALVFFGGPSIFNFAFIMSLGVIVGTFSSLFIAAPLLLLFHSKQEKSANGEVKSV